MKSNLNNLITSLMKTGKSPHKNSADQIRGITDDITNELVFDKEYLVNLKPMANTSKKNGIDSKKENNENTNLKELKTSKKIENDLEDKWLELKKVGAGLRNQGNTCFLNSTLQCLFYSRPLFNYLLSTKHSSNCMNGNLCMVCELKTLVKSCLLQNNSVVSPISILKKLKQIARHMRWGSQEDAHEFIRHVIDALHRCSLHKNPFSPSKKSSPIMKLFGGLLKSQIVCMQCNMESIKLDPFMDVSLEVRGVPSIEAGLARFTKAEVLEGENAYFCKNCKKKVRAKKRFLFYRLPEILTIQFKRYSMGGGKVSNHITFPSSLNLAPYTQDPSVKSHEGQSNHSTITKNKQINGDGNNNIFQNSSNNSNKHNSSSNNYINKNNTNLNIPTNHITPEISKACKAYTYQLYAVLVHEGGSTSSGHYYSYVRAPNAVWYCMNDSHVFQTSLGHVLKSQAYLLFYLRTFKPSSLTTPISRLIQCSSTNISNSSQTIKSPSKLQQSSSLPSSFSSTLNLNPITPPSTITSSKTSKPFTLNINDLLRKKKEKVIVKPAKSEIIHVHPSKFHSVYPNTPPIKSKSDSTCGLQIVGKSLKSFVKDKETSKSSSSSSSSSFLSSLSSSSSSSMTAKMRGGEMEKVSSPVTKKLNQEVTKTFHNIEDTVKYTSLWKIKPFVITSDNASETGKTEGVGNNPFNCLVRRSTSGLWRVEKLEKQVCNNRTFKKSKNLFVKGREDKLDTTKIKREDGHRLQNGLNEREEHNVISKEVTGNSSEYLDMDSHFDLPKARKDSKFIDNDDEIQGLKQELKPKKSIVKCDTFNWDSKRQRPKDDHQDGMLMKKKKLDLERLAHSEFSVPVSRWDGKDDEIKEEEKKKRDIESWRKRKYEEMDEEIDRGRVKKVKTKNIGLSVSDVNPFQVYQNKNYKKLRFDNGD